MKKGLIAGLVLLALSARPLYLMGREELVRAAVLKRYEIKPDYALAGTVGKTEVKLKDAVPSSATASEEVKAPITITVGKKDYPNTALAYVRPHYTDSNRYHGSAHLIRVRDRDEGVQYLVAIQNLGPDGTGRYHLHWRALWVSENGSAREDIFGYNDRGNPPIRALLANMASPSAMGFYSDILQGWPTLIFPIIYPLITGALGTLLILFCGIPIIKARFA